VARAIQSVLDQDYPNLEVIVIDDGSTDGSLDVIKSFGDRIRWQTGPNRGACAARNRGLGLTEAEYVMFLDADDYVEGPLLSAAIEKAIRQSADLIFCAMAVEFPDGRRHVLRHFTGQPDPLEVFENWLIEKSVGPCATIWRAAFIRQVGGWSEDLVKFQDGEVVLRSLMHYPRISSSSQGVGVYNAHDMPSLSKQTTRNSVFSEFISIERLRVRAKGTPFEVRTRGFAMRYYLVAQAAYIVGDIELGYRSLAIARELGLRGHPGTVAHWVASNVLGLRRKTALASAVRQARSALSRMWGRPAA
jgi:glycosyltransferase involved in cell wall biosynthesis